MKEHFCISGFILRDSLGEWWETLKTDGSLDTYDRKGGGMRVLCAKEFQSASKAEKAARNAKLKRWKVFKMTPPVPPSRTWGQLLVSEFNPNG